MPVILPKEQLQRAFRLMEQSPGGFATVVLH